MQCVKPITIRGATYPCGKCIACRIAKAREWSVRLMHELPYWSESVFLTLTYSDDYLPENRSLRKTDLQKFFKRLRKRIFPRKIKYFACGEYGEHTARPHYHAIIFGLGRDKMSREFIMDSWTFCDWSNFRVDKTFGSVTYDSCRYVSDYIFKKYDKVKADEEYTSKGLEIPFKVCSQGLGLRYCLEDTENLSSNFFVSVRGHKMALPRYYVNKLGLKLQDQNNENFKKWSNYAEAHNIHVSDMAEVILKQAEQREINLNARLGLHKKGSL